MSLATRHLRLLPLCLAAALAPSLAAARDDPPALSPSLDLEVGVVTAGKNDVRIPGDGGTRFSLTEGSFSTRASPYVRVQGGLAYGRHHLLATAALLRLKSGGQDGDPIAFAGSTFSPSATDATYRFDTYRLTYRYALVRRDRLELQVGATALLRSAEIKLTSGAESASKSNLGLVPLLSLRAAWRVVGPLSLVLDGDALAAPQGRAEDALLAVELDTGDLRFRVGYRIIEGGADNRSVYNFALLHHLAVGMTYAF